MGRKKKLKEEVDTIIVDDGQFNKRHSWKLVGAPYENEVKDLLANNSKIEDVRRYLKRRYDVEITYNSVLHYKNNYVIVNSNSPALIDRNLDERTKELLESARYYQDNLKMVADEIELRKKIANSIVESFVENYINEKKDKYGDDMIKYGNDIKKITDIVVSKMSPDRLTEMIKYRDKVFSPATIEKLMHVGNELFNNLISALSSFGIRITRISEDDEIQAKAFVQSLIEKGKRDIKL